MSNDSNKSLQELEEYLLYSEFLNVVAETLSIDGDDITNYIDKNLDEDMEEVRKNTYNDQSEECLDFEWIDDDDGDDYIEAAIMKCMLTIIELVYVLNNDVQKKKRKKSQRRWGVHPVNQLRKEKGHFNNLFEELLNHDHEQFFNFTRMSPDRFEHLLQLVGSRITKFSSNAIPAKCRLLITLRFLATGDSLKSLHYNFRIGVSTAHYIIFETCQALWDVLMPIYLKFPTEEDWIKIEKDFREKLNFPNCCGAVDGKLIEIFAPKCSGSMFYNYLKYFSTNLLAICDAFKNFVYVDIGSFGQQSDGGVLFHSTFGKRLDMDEMNFPQPAPLPHTTTSFPYFIIGDSAFPLKKNLLTPYSGDQSKLTTVEANFNQEQSSVRKIIENTFAILVRRWQIFSGPITMQPKMFECILKAAVVLHNYIKSFDDTASIRYMREDRLKYPSTEGLRSFYETGIRLESVHENEYAHTLRDLYANYLKNVI